MDHFNRCLQAVLFYLPCLVWHGLNSKAGVDADSILQAAQTLSSVDRTETNELTLKMITNQLSRFLELRRQARKRRTGPAAAKLAIRVADAGWNFSGILSAVYENVCKFNVDIDILFSILLRAIVHPIQAIKPA